MNRLRKLILISMGLLCIATTAKAQIDPGAAGYYNEALIFSQANVQGTARVQGMGSTQIALGGDVSSAHSNPAGLGLINRSQITFTPVVYSYNNTSSYFDNQLSDINSRLRLGNLGIVWSSPRTNPDSEWRGGSFAINYNRTNNFYEDFSYEARNPENSIIDYFLDDATGLTTDQLGGLTGMAYDIYLINPAYDQEDNLIPGQYDSFVFGLPRQFEQITREGSQSQFSISYGGNIADKFYFGLGIGLTSIDYRQVKNFSENAFDDPDPGIRDLNLIETLEIDAAGINASLGFIYRPTDQIRFGASIITPTYYSINEFSDATLAADYGGFYYAPEDITLNYEEVSFENTVNSVYDITTPMKISGGIAYFFGKNGFISTDVEYIDYANIQIRSNDFSTAADNRTIDQLYQSVVNLRLGGEYRYDIFRLRAGFGYYGNPYTVSDLDLSRYEVSVGGGLRIKNFFTDLAIVRSSAQSQTYSPYTFLDGSGPLVELDKKGGRAMLTLGFNF